MMNSNGMFAVARFSGFGRGDKITFIIEPKLLTVQDQSLFQCSAKCLILNCYTNATAITHLSYSYSDMITCHKAEQ